MKILWNQRESSLELVVVEEENVDQEEKSATITSDSTRLQSKDGSPEHHRGPFLTTASSSSSTSVQQLLGEVKGRGEKESEKCSGDNHIESDDNSSDDDDTSIASTIASDTSSTCSSSSSFGLEYEEEEEEEQDENDSNQEAKTTRNDKTKSVRFNLQANQIFPLVVRTNQQQEKGGAATTAADQKEASAEEDKEEFPWNQRGNGSRWHSKYSLWWYDSIKGKGKLLRKNNRYSHHHCSNSHLARPNYQPSQQEQPQEPEDNHPPNNDWMDPHLIWYTSRELAQMRAQVIPDVSTFLVQDMPRAARCLRQLRRMYKECSKEYSYSGCDWNDHDNHNHNNNKNKYSFPDDQDLEALLLHHGDDDDVDDRNHPSVLDDYDYKQQHERAAALAVDECQHQEEQAAAEDLLGIRQLLRDRFRLYVYDEDNDMMEEEEHKNKPDIETGGGGMFEKNRHNNNNDDNDNDNDDDDGFSIISIVGIEELVMDLGESKRQARREGQRFLQEHQQRQQPQDDAEGEDEDEDEDEHSDWHCPERKLVLELEPNNDDDDDDDSADPSHHRRPPRVPTTMFTAVSDASRTSSRFAHELALALAASLYPDKRSKTTN
ncbi:hypothetical protein ACA910_016712 [Epithemia clementina (nom. ined.)]